ncbi:MAG: methionine aminotransferase [Planctomycetota bacterium]
MTVAARFRPFGATIFAEMTALARTHNAINLSQGFPDFDGPAFVRDAARRAMDEGHNQYARLAGEPPLNEAIARSLDRHNGLSVDPHAEITVTNGCTEALAAVMLGLIEPGDEVVLFEPFYDSYRACVAMAGATARFVRLSPDAEGRFTFDAADLRSAISERTRAIVVNTPHNPTGTVLTREELECIAAVARERDLIVVSDEVYERLTYDGAPPHVSIATLPGMRERTITCSSLGKTFSFTGWKIGWAAGPPQLTAGIRAAHQFLCYAVATPLQHAAATALDEGDAAIEEIRATYQARRDELVEGLRDLGFRFRPPEGSYFIMADHTPLSEPRGICDDVAFARELTEHAGVAVIPPSAFYSQPADGARFVRFAFCKRPETLAAACDRLRRWAEQRSGSLRTG